MFVLEVVFKNKSQKYRNIGQKDEIYNFLSQDQKFDADKLGFFLNIMKHN